MRNQLLCVLTVVLLLPLSGCVSEEPSELEGDWFFGEDLVLDFKRDGVVISYAEDEEREGLWSIDGDGLLNLESDDDQLERGVLQFQVNGTWLFLYESGSTECVVLSKKSIENSVWYDELEALTYPSFCPSEAEA